MALSGNMHYTESNGLSQFISWCFFSHFVRYHGAKIRKLKVQVNGMLVDNPTSRYWRETGEFHLKPGLLQDYHTRKSSAALRLSGIQKRFSDGISDWARKWELPQDLCHHQQIVQLTFLNKNWFNKFDQCSIRVADDTPKNRYVENGIVDLHCYIRDILCKS